MQRFEAAAATVFGIVFLMLSFAVAIECIARKVFGFSLQGVDEFGGYCLAIGGSLTFAVTLLARAHIRIDILHEYFPRIVRVVLDVLSILMLTACAGSLLWMAWTAYSDSVLFQSSAQTPWATPLRYPQGLWTLALATFFVTALIRFGRALGLLGTARLDVLEAEFSPRSSKEEVEEELEDIRKRGVGNDDIAGNLKS